MTSAVHEPPHVSVVIAAWNAETTLARAINSALEQTLPVEVIVVDDASTDGSVAVAEQIAAADPRVRVMKQPHNTGPAQARNRALEHCTAPWVTVLDSDDFMDPERLRTLMGVAITSGADFVADDLFKVDAETPEGPRHRMWSQTDIGHIRLNAAQFVTANLSTTQGGRRELGFLKPLMSRKFLNDHALRYAPEIRLGEDYVLYARALILGAEFVLTDPAGYVAVVRANSLSGEHPTQAHEHLIAADRALLAVSGLDMETTYALKAHLLEQQKKWAWRRLIDAKRDRNIGAALACFRASPPVIADLVGRLAMDMWHRLRPPKTSKRAATDQPAPSLDVVVVADGRFAGGATSALVTDVKGLAGLGLRVGVLFVRSCYLDDSRDVMNPAAQALLTLEGVTAINPKQVVCAPLAFLHHPLVFFHGIEEQAQLQVERAIVVAHHAPFRNDGSLEYDPIATVRRAQRALGLAKVPWFAPIAPGVRQQLASFAPLLRMTSEDWPNIFDTNEWPTQRKIFQQDHTVIGRHGRADPLKFPATGAEINAALPVHSKTTVRLLGCPTDALAAKGAAVEHWDIVPFGGAPVVAFLNSLDVFVYHYHPNLTEAFGRTVVEAMLSGCACILDPRLRGTFGDMAHYCDPTDTAAVLAQMRADPAGTQAQVDWAREQAASIYGLASLGPRLQRFQMDVGTTERAEATVPPLTTVRKWAGLYRRRRQTVAGYR